MYGGGTARFEEPMYPLAVQVAAVIEAAEVRRLCRQREFAGQADALAAPPFGRDRQLWLRSQPHLHEQALAELKRCLLAGARTELAVTRNCTRSPSISTAEMIIPVTSARDLRRHRQEAAPAAANSAGSEDALRASAHMRSPAARPNATKQAAASGQLLFAVSIKPA